MSRISAVVFLKSVSAIRKKPQYFSASSMALKLYFSETTKLLWIFFEKIFHFIHYDWFMKALFLQPTTYQTDDFLYCRLWKRQDASFVQTAMTHINMQVLVYMMQIRKSEYKSCIDIESYILTQARIISLNAYRTQHEIIGCSQGSSPQIITDENMGKLAGMYSNHYHGMERNHT